ncbi:Deoxyhypusine synthase [Parelaphostrongylus tenuis]|uniref:Deoxyhypusine synthase n=1 Tax=Parelaphostrongylus tenuis TaxID=148309 RepID=A0AAD5R1E6_PARTN|nr:Deoxyhypusine synthase [Parelaphostrongylus tenuis]
MADNQQKAVYAVWWSMVQAFWKRYGPDPIREEKLSEAIKQWCLEVTKDYEEVSVCDFTSSWRDGYAFNCLLHSFDGKETSDLHKTLRNRRYDSHKCHTDHIENLIPVHQIEK